MPKRDRKTGVGEAKQGGSPAREKNAFDLGERWLGPANKLDYLIRRRVIPDHPYWRVWGASYHPPILWEP